MKFRTHNLVLGIAASLLFGVGAVKADLHSTPGSNPSLRAGVNPANGAPGYTSRTQPQDLKIVVDPANRPRVAGPRRDTPPASHFAFFQNQFGWSDYNNIWTDASANWDLLTSGDMAGFDINDYQAIWIPDYQDDQFNTDWNDNLAKFETWIDAGGALYMCTGTNNWDVAPVCPGGVVRNAYAYSYNGTIQVSGTPGPNYNYFAALNGWTGGETEYGNYFCHATFNDGDFAGISNSDYHQVIATADDNGQDAAVVYNYGNGWVFATGTTDGYEYYSYNGAGQWGAAVPNIIWYLDYLAQLQNVVFNRTTNKWYSSISSALTASAAGNVLIANNGTYNENVTLSGHNVTLASRYWHTGADADIGATTIMGTGGNAAVTSSTNNMATLQGFTVSGGTGHMGLQGGGVYMYHSKMTLSHCTVRGNSTAQGGGIYATGSPLASILACTVNSNTATTYGGGIALTATSPTTMDSCTVDSNSAPNGGGLYVLTSNGASISNSTISKNAASVNGGGFYMSGSAMTIQNCTVSNNTAVTQAGGLKITGCSPTLTGCTISGNSAPQGGGVNAMTANGTAFNNCNFLSNTASTLGGGMSISTTNATIEGCTFDGNNGGTQGGGLRISSSAPTVHNCTFTNNNASEGAGIFANAAASAVIRSCTLEHNTAPIYGGGVVISMSNPLTLDSCTVDSNNAGSGAGIYAASSNSPTISNSWINSNVATDKGGGIYLTASSLMVENCSVSNNSATNLAGGIRITGCHPTFDNCTINGNSSPQGGGVNAMTANATNFNNCTLNSNTGTMLGGGMALTSANVVIDSCTFNGNNGGPQGGGLRIYNSVPTITNSTFSNNTAAQGGGINAANATGTSFSNDAITGNTGSTLGGGMQVSSSNITMDSCLISGNNSPQGAGMRLYISNPTIAHTTIVDNHASTGAKYGGGFACTSGSSPTFTQCTFSNNTALKGGAVWCFAGGNPTFNTCILYNDTPKEIYFQSTGAANATTLTYCDLKGGQPNIQVNGNGSVTFGTGNFDSDPLFINPGGGDYGLTVSSPCIDTGDPGLTYDEDATIADVGAHIYDQDFDAAGKAKKIEAAVVAPKEFALGSAYPNPFNSTVRVPYSVPSASRVVVALFDMDGRQIAKLVDEVKPAGTFEVSWVATNAPAGIYLVRMNAANYDRTERLVLLK